MPDDEDETRSDDEPQVGAEADDTTPADDTPASAREQPGDGRGWKIAAVVAVLAAAFAVGTLGSLLLFDGGGSGDPDGDVHACIPSRDFTKEAKDEGDDCPPKGAEKLDGLVEKTSEGGFTIRVIDQGRLGETVQLHVREPDRPYIDIAHAQTHAALGQPIRVYLEEIDGRKAVVYMEDAPLLR